MNHSASVALALGYPCPAVLSFPARPNVRRHWAYRLWRRAVAAGF